MIPSRPIQCVFCTRYQSPMDRGDFSAKPTQHCSAFGAAPIPDQIWHGEADHRQPYPGDHGEQFDPIKGSKFPESAIQPKATAGARSKAYGHIAVEGDEWIRTRANEVLHGLPDLPPPISTEETELRFNPNHGFHGHFAEGTGGVGGGGAGPPGRQGGAAASVTSSVPQVERDLKAGQDTYISPRELPALLTDMANQPSTNLAHLQVRGMENAHLYQEHLREIPREDMPQLPERMDQLQPFTDRLGEMGVGARIEHLDPRSLVMTQNQLDSAKVGFLYGKIHGGGWAQDTVMIASREGAILDGHHRWAAASAAVVAGDNISVNVLRVDMGIDDLLGLAQQFSGAHKGMGAPAT